MGVTQVTLVHNFTLYDLFIVCFVQLVLTLGLVLSPARDLDTRFRWTGSRVTEVLVGAVGAIAIAGVSAVLSVLLWGLSAGGAETAAYVLALVSIGVIIARRDRGVIGVVFYATYASAGFAFLAFAALVATAATHSTLEALTSTVLIVLDLATFLVWNTNINYTSDVLSRTRHSRPRPNADPSYQPMVSLHIPAHNEPPELLIETIKAVERIDYPDFEIVVLDNNTTDPAVWRPVEEYCRGRDRVKFVHVEDWPGYKAGACNLALRRYTDPRAEIIGLIDADDIVQPYYLRETVPYFSDAQLGFVQTNEGNRDYQGTAYGTACVTAYQSFYLSVMSSRNERDAVPFVGTMGLFRRRALEGIGGWNEWCISEDTEASLRVLKQGWSGLYIPRCFGRGIVPPTYAGLSTQRHRWCFGAMQILRLHWRSLMPWDRSPDNHLTRAQRRDYLVASLSWFRDLLMLAFALILLAITGLLAAGSNFAFTPLGGDRSLLPISLILVATICMTYTLRRWTSISLREALGGLVISLSACWITALACVQGLAHREGVFLRTSKTGADKHRVRTALRLSRVEVALAVSLYASAGLLAARRHPPVLLLVIIFIQATVYLCAPIAALWNVRAQRVPADEMRRRTLERRLADNGRRQRSFARPALGRAVLLALSVGAAIAVFARPSTLIPVPARTIGPVHLVEHGHPETTPAPAPR